MAIRIFTDGSSRGNPGPGGWAAVVVARDVVREFGGREAHTTNNRMEITAAIEALKGVRALAGQGPVPLSSEAIEVFTDSKYLIQGITAWVRGWKRNGWKTAAKKDVENRDLWERLDAAVEGLSIAWSYIRGHAGHPGNERCDEIATSFADENPAELYSGSREAYPIDLDAAPVVGSLKDDSSKSGSKKKSAGPAYSYLSLVDGVLMKHKTWAECEARVKGVRGTKFKKAMSAADEAAIMKEWGV